MEKYRDDLAGKLNEIRNSNPENKDAARAKASGYLDAKKETEEYKSARKKHHEDIEKNILSKEEERVSSMPAEERLQYVLDKEPKLKMRYSDEQVVKFLEKVDQLVEIGVLINFSVLYVDDALEYFTTHTDDFPDFDSKAEYDESAIVSEVQKLLDDWSEYEDIEKILKYSDAKKISNVDLVDSCDGDHEFADSFSRPTTRECPQMGQVGVHDRALKFYNFLQNYKKSS